MHSVNEVMMLAAVAIGLSDVDKDGRKENIKNGLVRQTAWKRH